MDTIKLKNYFKQATNLEMSIHTNKEVISNYKTERNQNTPLEPEHIVPEEPKFPMLSLYSDRGKIKLVSIRDEDLHWKIIKLRIFGCISFIPLLVFVIPLFGNLTNSSPSIADDYVGGVVFFTILFSIIGIACLIYQSILINSATLDAKAEDEKKKLNYKKELEEYKEKQKIAKEKYVENMQLYNLELQSYNFDTEKQLNQLLDLHNSLISVLDKLYSANIIYPKYRNLVAVSTIYEYLESGRCQSLDGPYGAYNLYESELRDNIVIDSLSQIMSDIQQIKHTQYGLYEQLKLSNQILNNIHNDTALTSYFTKATAEAAAADRYIIGMGIELPL